MRITTLAALLVLSSSCSPAEPHPPGACAGAVELSEGTRTVVDVPAISIADAAGLEAQGEDGRVAIRAPYGSGGRHVVQIECDGASGSIEVIVRALAWAPVARWDSALSGPPGREYGTMWIDEGSPDRLLVFGGFHYVPAQFTPAWDLWQYDLSAGVWTELMPGTEPPHFPGGRVAPVPGERAIVYLGGVDGNTTPSSFVRLDYAPEALSFSDMPGAATAPGSYNGAIVYDAPRRRWISVCGMSTQDFTCDPWVYGPEGGWARLPVAPGPSPEPRYGFFHAYDERAERLIVFSGDTDGTSWEGKIDQRTWALDLSRDPARWVELLGPGSPPIGRRNGAQAHDPEGHRLFVWGGTADGRTTMPGLFVLDLEAGHEAWTRLELAGSPPERSSGMGVYDAARRRVLFGFGNGPEPREDLWALQL